MKKIKKRVLSMLMALLMFAALLPLGTIFSRAADMNGQTVTYSGGAPAADYYLTYTASRPNNSQMTYNFTVRTKLRNGWVLTGWKLTAVITVNGVSGSAVVRERNAQWGSTNVPDPNYHYCYITVTCPSTAGNADQSASFRVDRASDNASNWGVINSTGFTVRSAGLNPTAPGKPLGASISSSTVLPGQKATLAWDAGSAGTNNPIKHYDVYYRDSQSISFSGDYTYFWSGNATSAAVDPPAQGRYRQYAVRTVAQNAPNYSDWVAAGPVYCPYTYPVSYDANGGSGAPAGQTKVQYQTLSLSATAPTRDGYTFKGWSSSNTATSAAYQPGWPYNGDAALTLYAVWEVDIPPVTATLTFDYGENGGINADTHSIGVPTSPFYFDFTRLPGKITTVVEKGRRIPLDKTAPLLFANYLVEGRKPGWEFLGWNTNPDADRGLVSVTMDDYDITLYAIYRRNITGTVRDASGSWPVSVTLYNKETSKPILTPKQASYATWTPAGWSAGIAPDAEIVDRVVLADGTNNFYYGIYERRVTLSYDCPDEPPVNEDDCEEPPPAPIDDTDDCEEPPPAPIDDSSLITVQAAASSGTVASQTDSARINSYSLTTIAPAVFTVAAPPERAGYAFLGWSDSDDTDEVQYQPGDSLRTDVSVTIYSVWERITHKLTYDYAVNGGTGGDISAVDVGEGDAVDLSVNAVKPGWDFIGWTDVANGNSTEPLTGKAMPSNNATIYAIYQKTLTGRFTDAAGTQTDSTTIYNKATSGTVLAQTQREYPGWTNRGWGTATAANASPMVNYTVTVAQGLRDFYGLYQRNIVLSYDANGGSSAPQNQRQTQYANSFDLSAVAPQSFAFTIPSGIPTRSGYNFKGWADSSTATAAQYQPGGSYTASADATLYAVWQPGRWLSQSETYAFANEGNNFGSSYYITDSDFEKLSSYVRGQYSAASARTLINQMQDMRLSEWKGSCYGMATTAILHKQNKISMRNFDPGAATLRNVAVPTSNNAVRSAINYYMVSQKFLQPSFFSASTPTVWRVYLGRLVESAQNGNLMLLCYSFLKGNEEQGHAIVVIGYEKAADGSHNLIAYDNRYPNRDVIVNIDTGYNVCIVDGREVCVGVGYMSDMSAFDSIDIDGPDNDMIIRPVNGNKTPDSTEISILAQGTTTVTNKAGQTLTYNAETGETSGTMEVLSSHMFVNSTASGEPAPVTKIFVVPNSDAFTMKSSGQGIDVSITNQDIYASACAGKADTVVIAKDEGISVLGDGQMEYTASLSMNNSLADMVRVDGKAIGGASLQYSGEDIKASGAANGAALTVFSGTVDARTIDFSTPAAVVLVTGDGSGKAGNVDIKYDSNGDGSFDKSVFDTTQKPVANGSTSVTLDYVGSMQLSVTGENLTWSGGNQSVSVDQNGRITSLKNFSKTGSATIKATNSAGSVEFNVSVKPTFMQWIMIVVLFGWIWM